MANGLREVYLDRPYQEVLAEVWYPTLYQIPVLNKTSSYLR